MEILGTETAGWGCMRHDVHVTRSPQRTQKLHCLLPVRCNAEAAFRDTTSLTSRPKYEVGASRFGLEDLRVQQTGHNRGLIVSK